jgi:hypothetical protein
MVGKHDVGKLVFNRASSREIYAGIYVLFLVLASSASSVSSLATQCVRGAGAEVRGIAGRRSPCRRDNPTTANHG